MAKRQNSTLSVILTSNLAQVPPLSRPSLVYSLHLHRVHCLWETMVGWVTDMLELVMATVQVDMLDMICSS